VSPFSIARACCSSDGFGGLRSRGCAVLADGANAAVSARHTRTSLNKLANRPDGLRAPDDKRAPEAKDLLPDLGPLGGRARGKAVHHPVLAQERRQLRTHLGSVLAVHQPEPLSRSSVTPVVR
jgi:hypothetical protein